MVYAELINRLNVIADKYAALLSKQLKKDGTTDDDEGEGEGGDTDM